MRMLVVTVLLVFAAGACSLVFDSQTSATEHLTDAGDPDQPQQDAGCNTGGDGGYDHDGGGYHPDGGYWPPDAAEWPVDGGSWPIDGGGWPDGGLNADAGLWPDGGP